MAESSQRKHLPGSDTESQRIYAEIYSGVVLPGVRSGS